MKRIYKNIILILILVSFGLWGEEYIPYDKPECAKLATVGVDEVFKGGIDGNWTTTFSTDRRSHTITYCVDSQLALYIFIVLLLSGETLFYSIDTIRITLKRKK